MARNVRRETVHHFGIHKELQNQISAEQTETNQFSTHLGKRYVLRDALGHIPLLLLEVQMNHLCNFCEY